MELFNPTCLSSMSYCDLNTRFNDRCHMDWSKTNLISIVTLEGIYILEPYLEQSYGPFRLELIRNPTNKFRHKLADDNHDLIQFDDKLSTLTNKQYMEIFLDPSLSTNIESISGEHTNLRRFRLASWSPVMNKYPRECLLAAITIDYQLLIFARQNGAWVCRADLSQLFDEAWTNLRTRCATNAVNRPNYESTRESLHALSFCHLCWDTRDRQPNQTSDGNLNLLATTIHGDLVIWRLTNLRRKACRAQPAVDQLQAEIKIILKTRQSNISCMSLHNGLLIAASRNGQVALYDLNISLENIDAGILFTATHPPNQRPTKQSKQSGTNRQSADHPIVLDLPPTTVLWHQDNIEVMDFYLQAIDREKSRMVLTKSTNICWCMIHYIKRSETQSATLIVEDSFSAIDGLTPEVSLHQTPAIWLKAANNKRAVLIADDGSFFLLNFLEDHQDVSPSFSPIPTDKVDLTDMIPRGVCVSPNGHLISMISSVTYLFDPIRLPAPTKLIALPMQGDKDFLSSCLRNLLDETWLQSKGIKSPMEIGDLIDYLRSLFPLWTSRQCDKLKMLLKASLYEMGEPKTEVQLLKLKIIGFLLLKLINLRTFISDVTDNDMIEYDLDLDRTVYPMVLYHEINEVLAIVKKDPINYSLDHMNSLQNYLLWMDMDCSHDSVGLYQEMRCNTRNELRKHLGTLLQMCPQPQEIKELCPICKCLIPFESVYYAQCTNQHRFVRCSRSLLTVDSRIDDLFECNQCKKHYIMDRLWPTSNLWPCLYCN